MIFQYNFSNALIILLEYLEYLRVFYAISLLNNVIRIPDEYCHFFYGIKAQYPLIVILLSSQTCVGLRSWSAWRFLEPVLRRSRNLPTTLSTNSFLLMAICWQWSTVAWPMPFFQWQSTYSDQAMPSYWQQSNNAFLLMTNTLLLTMIYWCPLTLDDFLIGLCNRWWSTDNFLLIMIY